MKAFHVYKRRMNSFCLQDRNEESSVLSLSSRKGEHYLFYSFLFIILGLLLIFKLRMKELFDEKYFYDSNKILYLMKSGINLNDKAFDFSAKFYNFLNIFGVYDWGLWALILNFITIPIILLSISFIKPKRINVLLIVWLLTSLTLLQIYVTHISKEWITFLFSLIILIILKKNQGKILFISLAILAFLYSYFFRTYFALIFLYFCVFYVFLNYRKSRFWLIFILMLILALIPNRYLFDVFYIRQDINYFRVNSTDAQTMILDVFVSNNNFIMLINYLLCILRILFPLEIIFISFNIKYMIFIMYILLNSYIIFFNLKNYKKLSRNQQNNLIFLLSILFVHGIFEPDFGSYIRHLISYFFILYFNILTYIDFKSLKSNKV